MSGGVNPYGRVPPRKPGEAPGPLLAPSVNMRYAVKDIPDSTDPTYTDGYSPELHNSSNGSALPDDIRMGTRQPPLNDPNDPKYLYRRESDRIQRESDEQTITGWKVKQQKVAAPIVPEWSQERMPIRPTADDSPTGYMFTRPWHIPRNIEDAVGEGALTHLSMADHRRAYPIGTMVPRGGIGVNTYRADPSPWDEDLQTAVRPSYRDDPGGILTSAAGGNRTWRL